MIDELQQTVCDLGDTLAILQNEFEANKPVEFLTSNNVMEWLKISRPTLHRWKEKGVLIAYNVGGKILFKRSEILEMVDGCRMKVA
jgi:excisionase family DNA binding protein